MASVIKASGPIRIADGMSFNLEDMDARAQVYLEGIRGHAGELLKQAQQQADTIRRDAEQQGHQAAIRAVERVMDEKVTRQVNSLVPALKLAVEEIRSAQHQMLDQWHRQALHVACQIAARILRSELTRQPQVTETLIREALEMAVGSPEITLRLNPQDQATLGKNVELLTKEVGQLGRLEIVADPAITPGGCRVETRSGTIDQQIETQLKRIEEELL